jgi:hypothetical protein
LIDSEPLALFGGTSLTLTCSSISEVDGETLRCESRCITVNQIDRFSMNFKETIGCSAKSSVSPMAERQLEAFAVVEVGGSKQPVAVPTSRIKSFSE